MQVRCLEMAIIEELLADFETSSGKQYRIEYNQNGYIHLHTEHIRVDLTPEEFLQIVDTVIDARSELLEVKDGISTK